MTSPTAPRTFAETLARVEALILQDFDREIVEKQLYYHGRDHADTVRRRAARLLNAVAPYLDLPADGLARLEGLLSLCAAAHDAIQIFEPQELPHGSRWREPGVSEAVTIERLIAHIQSVQRLPQMLDSARFTEEELQTVRDAINATVCLDDASDQAVYQPAPYRTGKPPPLVAQLLAMADIIVQRRREPAFSGGKSGYDPVHLGGRGALSTRQPGIARQHQAPPATARSLLGSICPIATDSLSA